MFTKLVIAGSTGYVADAAICAILASKDPVFDVTILTRRDSGRESPSRPGAKVIPVDYGKHDDLVHAVSGADAILSFIAGTQSKLVDLLLLKAAREAGVRRIFPSEYTLDILHPHAVSLLTEGGHWPEEISPVATARKFLALADEGGLTSFTTLIPAAFMDGWLEGNFGLIDPKNHKVTAVDSGDRYFSGCSIPFLTAAIVAVLRMDEEKTKNKRIPITEVRATMNQIADVFEEITGTKFERGLVTSQELVDQRNTNLQAGNPLVALFAMIQLAAFDGIGAGDLKEGLGFDGDGYLDVQRKSLKELSIEALTKVETS
ncbi:isoflavone reductase family protein [Penicillium canariense]|uniref:Isoflavone reductase family protein n=1 Tax=Penicillium canariense TaxID=189055 RepID=A0A9W9LFS2_9EURO|nr:isoflavone reductase family protein [Penicillium canariense]KAJ5153024.1 isoflavone reductase family protein [Penicillium canariense]